MVQKNQTSTNSKDEERKLYLQLPSANSTEIVIGTEDEDKDNSSSESILLPDHAARKQSALDAVISKIGMGRFQKQLLVLCGLGWFADNMWLQCIAVILPRVKVHYDVDEKIIGLLSSSVFIGMTFGALFWGVLSDTHGRKQAFNLTLAVTTFFGVFSSFSQSFAQLCFLLFLLGFGVGGNMPVDGALFLEFIPKTHQYLLTFMSVFFSLGAVLTSVLAYFILPPYSCHEVKNCDVNKQNNGWRFLLGILGSLTFLMLICRLLFFRLQESPKFLISHNRKHDAILVLRRIAHINGSNMQIKVSDFPTTPSNNITPHSSNFSFQNSHLYDIKFRSEPITYLKQRFSNKIYSIKSLFTRRWIVTTILVWSIWALVSFAYTTFNVFLPTFLEHIGLSDGEDIDNQELMRGVLKDYVVYSLCGVPGSILGSFLIETFLGRKGSMAMATFGTSLAVFLFSRVRTHTGEVISSAMVSLLATLNYAVIYGYTPEVFEAKLRGTACGIASAWGRISGIISPVITGALLAINITIPLYLSAFLFAISGICMVLLPIETKGRQA